MLYYKRQFQTLHEKMEKSCIRYARIGKPHGHQGRSRVNSKLYTRRWRIHAFAMLGSVSHTGIKVDQEPHSQSTVGTAAPAVAAMPPAVAYTLSASNIPCRQSNNPVVAHAQFTQCTWTISDQSTELNWQAQTCTNEPDSTVKSRVHPRRISKGL
jgi:hypothetical protein